MKISLKTKLIVAFAVVTLIPSVAATIVGVRLLGTRIVTQAQEKVAYDLNTARIIYHSRLNYVETVTRDSAIRFVTREALENKNAYIILDTLEKTRQERSLDMLGLVGSDGRILVRAQNPAMHGDSVKADILIEKCLGTKRSISGSIIMCSERLLNEGVHLAERANIEIIPTPHTAPREGKAETSGMVLEACAPVFNDKGELLGAVYGGVLLNRNYDIVDEVKETAYKGLTYRGKEIGTATIFQGDLRISTNVHSSDEGRAIGTRVSEEVNRQVLQEGGTWTGPAFVVNDWYLSAYEPIRNVEGKVIGMLYVGILEQEFSDLKANTFLLFLVTAAAGVAIALAVSFFIAAKISRPVVKLARASRALSRGDFSVSVDRTSQDEIGELEETFNMMARSIRERDERLKEETRQKLTQSEKLAAIGRLAAGVAHQINNPLTTVLIRSELLLRKAQDEQKEDLEAVIKEANRCSQIVKGLLDFSRQSVPRKDAIGLNEILSEVVSLVKNQARINNVEILEDYAQNLPAVVVDQDQLREVFLNITLNALDAMPDGGVLLLSTYFTKKPEPRVCVTIEDSGIGIPKENIPKLFDPFFTTKEKGKGTGLGLAVSYGIVQAHNGTIEVESTVGKGTKCTVVLPTSARRMDGTARVIAVGGQGSESSKSENPGG